MKKSNKKSKTINKKNVSWENNKNVRIILVVILILSIGILFGTIGYTMYKWSEHSKFQSGIIAVRYVDTSVQIVPYGVGINGDTDSLKFGKVPFGGGGERALYLNITQEAVVNITITGDMAKFMSVNKNEFIIQPNKRDEVVFYLDVPEGAVTGNYTGLIRVLFLKP